MNTNENTNPDFELLEEEIQQERKGFDLFSRLAEAPKRKPEVVTLHLNAELIQEFGYARDVEVKNELGIVTERRRERSGVYGDLDRALAAKEPNQKLIAELTRKAKKLKDALEKDSITFTLQWVPPMIEESIRVKAMRSIGVKQAPVPKDKGAVYYQAWLARMIEACTVSVVDNASMERKDGITVQEASQLSKILPPAQFERLESGIAHLQDRDALSSEALDTADF